MIINLGISTKKKVWRKFNFTHYVENRILPRRITDNPMSTPVRGQIPAAIDAIPPTNNPALTPTPRIRQDVLL